MFLYKTKSVIHFLDTNILKNKFTLRLRINKQTKSMRTAKLMKD